MNESRRSKGKTAIAKKMLAKGNVPLDFIVEMTALSLPEVKKLQAKMQAAN